MYADFWRLFVGGGYGRLRPVLLLGGLSTAVALLEGFNVGLLVPLLETLASPGQEGGHWISRTLAAAFDALGIPFKLVTIVLVLAVFVLAIAALKYLRMIVAGKVTEGFLLWLRSKYMWNLLHADMSYFHSEKLGVLTDTLITQTPRAGGTVKTMNDILVALGTLVAYLVAAFLIAPVLTAVAIAMILLVSVGMQYYVNRAEALGVTLLSQDREYQVAALENLSGIHVVKTFVQEWFRWANFDTKAQALRGTAYRHIRNQSQMVVIQEVALFALIGAIVVIGVSVLDLGMAVVVAILFILYRLMPRVSGLNVSRQDLAGAMAALRAVKAAIEEPSQPKIISGNTPFKELHISIELRNVCFSYADGSVVLRDVDFTIEKGKMTAIIGASGVGKSTLVDLILRHYDPVQGSILVDGVALTELDLSSWRTSIGLVSQDIFLFNDTVASNISLGRDHVTRESIIDAATQAYAHEFIQNLPQGYDTEIGDRGWNLSGGQRQRLALARAILKRPEILILDEATSSLDSESERMIQQYMSEIRGSCTMVVVAHRLSTIQGADKIVVLEDGTVVEEGTWDKLRAGSGVLANYQRLQSGG